jgi:predicted transcriptional regulator
MERKSPDATLHVRLEPELRSQLEQIARAEDRPLSSLVRRVLRAEAARRGPDDERVRP